MNRLLTIVDSKYQRLEYLESTGTQYIDTGVYLTGDSRVKIKAQSSFTDTGFRLFGSEYTNEIFRFGTSKSGDNIRWYSGYYNSLMANQNLNYDQTVFEVDFNKNKVYVNNVLVNTHTYHEFTATHTAYLFTINQSSVVIRPSKIYYCQIYNNDVLIRNFVPVLRKTDNELGMLDLVEGKFYTNAGTGKFTANLDTMYAIIQGSPTQSPYGVFSGFSESNYLTLQQQVSVGQNTKLDIVIKINANTIDQSSSFLGTMNSVGLAFRISGANYKLSFYLGDGSNWIVNALTGTTILETNKDYYARVKIDNGVITIYLSTDGTNWTQEATTTVTFSQTYNYLISLGTGRITTAYFKGSVDLNRSYIKIDNTKYKLQAVVGYTVVGSPTITDGVVSGFSADNWLSITSSIPDNRIEDYNFYTKFTISSTSRQSIIGYYGSSHNFGIMTDNKKILFVIGRTSSNTEPTITSSVTYNIGDTVYVNAYYLGNNVFVLKTSLDGINWNIDTLEINITTINNIQANYPFRIGRAVLNNYAWVCEGSIYVNETYIKIKNKLWFNGQQS